MNYILSEDQIKLVLSYLITKPYNEVFKLIYILQALPIQEEDKKIIIEPEIMEKNPVRRSRGNTNT